MMRYIAAQGSVTGGDDAGLLNHEHRTAYRCDWPVKHASGYADSVSGPERDRVPAFELDLELAVEDEEELVLLVVLVPVKLAVHDAESQVEATDVDERLVVPGRSRCVDEGLDVHDLQRPEQRLVVDRVRPRLGHRVSFPACSGGAFDVEIGCKAGRAM